MTKVRGHLVWCAVVCCLTATGLPSASQASGRPNGRAIQFRVGSHITPLRWDGAAIAYQRFVGRNVAWRVSLGTDLRHDIGEASGSQAGENEFDGSYEISEWDYEAFLVSEWLV